MIPVRCSNACGANPAIALATPPCFDCATNVAAAEAAATENESRAREQRA